MTLKLADLIGELTGVCSNSRILGRYKEARVVVKTGKDTVRPVKLVGVDAGGTVVIMLEDEGAKT